MKISKKKIRMQTLLVNPIIDLERPLEMILKKGKYIVIKCHNIPGDNDSGSYEINLPYYGWGPLEEWLVWKDKFLKALDGQSISMGPLWYMFTKKLLIGEAKAIFNQATLDIGIHYVNNFNKVLLEMTKHAFQAYAFCEQKRHLCRHLAKPRSMKLPSLLKSFRLIKKAKKLHLRRNHGHHLPFYANHMEKQDDWIRFQLCRFYYQNWFFWN